MTAAGKARARGILRGLDADGGTNIWGGLQQALEAVQLQQRRQAGSAGAANAAVVLLTDGEPTTHKPEEIVLLLRTHLGRPDGGLAGTLHTVGYGYSLDSGMLTELGALRPVTRDAFSLSTSLAPPLSLMLAATLGHGTFSFVPDGTMVATVFVNLMAYVSTSCVPAVAVSVTVG